MTMPQRGADRRPRQQLSQRPAEWDAYEAYFTPLPVVLQGLRSLATLLQPPRVILDLGAGSGGFGQAAASVWAGAHLVAVEARASEAPHLRRHYHSVHLMDARTGRLPPADLVMSNPPFSLALTLAERAFGVVRPGGAVAFLVRQTWGDAEAVEELLLRRPPILELTISGRVSMGEAGQKTKDQFGYRWLLWQGLRPRGSAWRRVLLPRLAVESLSWTARPGTGRLLGGVEEDQIINLKAVLR